MKNIIDVATQAGNFKILLSAFKAASLIDMLRSPGQYTVFAPTDEAFKRLPAGSLDALFKDSRTLRPFLRNHIMRGSARRRTTSCRASSRRSRARRLRAIAAKAAW